MTVTVQLLSLLVIHTLLWKNSPSGSCDKCKVGETTMMRVQSGSFYRVHRVESRATRNCIFFIMNEETGPESFKTYVAQIQLVL